MHEHAILIAIVVVLILVLVYAAWRRPRWAAPAFWLANFVETPEQIYKRSGGTFDEEAALALDRSSSAAGGGGRGSPQGDPNAHYLAASIISRNIIGQEHRPETGADGRPTPRALERTRLRRDMFGRARGHYLAALHELARGPVDRQRERRQAGAADIPPTTMGGAAAAARPRRRPRAVRPPDNAVFIIDAAQDFAFEGGAQAAMHDPLLEALGGVAAVLLGGGRMGPPLGALAYRPGGGHPLEAMVPMAGMDAAFVHGGPLHGPWEPHQLFVDIGLAQTANHTRAQVVGARRDTARQVARATAAGAPGARVEAYMGMATAHNDDTQNSHDPGVNGCLRGVVARLRRDQAARVAPLPTLDAIEADIRARFAHPGAKMAGGALGGAGGGGAARQSSAALADALAVVARARNGETNIAVGVTDADALRLVWARADDPQNAANRENIRQAAVDALTGAWEDGGIGGRKIVCVNGRTARMLSALAALDHDKTNWNVATLEQFKNDVFERTKALVHAEATAAAAALDPQLAAVGRSFLAKTAEEMKAATQGGAVTDDANARFTASLSEKITPLVHAYVAEVNASSPGAIPPHMVDPIIMEAKAAVE